VNAARGPVAAGFAALRHRKLIVLLTLTTVALGICAALPMLPTLHQTMVNTLAGDHFLRNDPTKAPTDLFDFFLEKDAVIDGTRHSIGGLGVLGIVLQMFFAGGIVVVLGQGPFAFGQFFEPARRNFWHNFKCFLVFGIAAGAALWGWIEGVGDLRSDLVEHLPPESGTRSLTFWILALVALLIYAALSLLYDFARAARRYAPRIGAWRAFRFAARALSDAWGRALALWLFWFLLGGAAVVALLAATWFLRAGSAFGVMALVVLQITVVAARSAVRVAAWGSYVAFLEPRSARALSDVAKVRVSSAPYPAPSAATSGF
jgi:MFS family permease